MLSGNVRIGCDAWIFREPHFVLSFISFLPRHPAWPRQNDAGKEVNGRRGLHKMAVNGLAEAIRVNQLDSHFLTRLPDRFMTVKFEIMDNSLCSSGVLGDKAPGQWKV